jgi:hypothetical protein
MAEHRQMPTTLDSYDLDEVELPLGEDRRVVKATRITIQGKNIFLRALEPTIRIGEVEVLYPRIQPDERTIVGYLTTSPPEGAQIQLEYRGQEPIRLAEPFTMKKLEGRQVAEQ